MVTTSKSREYSKRNIAEMGLHSLMRCRQQKLLLYRSAGPEAAPIGKCSNLRLGLVREGLSLFITIRPDETLDPKRIAEPIIPASWRSGGHQARTGSMISRNKTD